MRPVPGRWYKVASLTQDDWFGFGGLHAIPNQLVPEPGMPQALGFASWQAMYEDIVAIDGVIAEVGLHYTGTSNNNPTATYMARHPADSRLLPEGQQVREDPHEWIYFTWDVSYFPASPNIAYVRVQHDPGGPVMLFDFGINAGWDRTYSLWVLM